jgi:hypothetical protein
MGYRAGSAFYDFVKDLSPLLIGVTVVRVAVRDPLVDAGRSKTAVEEILLTLIRQSAPIASRESSSAALAALVKERAAD